MATMLRETFAACHAKGKPAFITFITAGFPNVSDTPEIMLAMQKGGADIIELGVPFSDPIADGPSIQAANNVAIDNGVSFKSCLEMISSARKMGLTVPVLLMGYYNPFMAYGEEKAVQDAALAGAQGFIVVDLPPKESLKFRTVCSNEGLSYVPLIAPSTTEARIAFLAGIADSFIYVVSKMATTGSSNEISNDIPGFLARIRQKTDVPLAVGFNISTREHFAYVDQSGADGVVIGSKIINLIKEAHENKTSISDAVEKFCSQVCGQNLPPLPKEAAVKPSVEEGTLSGSMAATSLTEESIPGEPVLPASQEEEQQRFGDYGGAYVPESLSACLSELEQAYKDAKNDPAFWEEWRGLYNYMGRPSNLYEAPRLTEHAGGAKIWLKREDLNHTGSHKINNAIGQILLARRLGKTRIIAETGAGQHGVATATACAKFGLKCCIYMGAEDVRRQGLNVFRMRMLGAEVVSVESGSKTLKDAINEAMREWVTSLSTTHYLIGSALGPHPFPEIVRDFQSVIGKEIKEQLRTARGKLPDAVVACVGGGSNAIGTFYDFIGDESVRLVGVEAGGDGVDTDRHSATLTHGKPGVLHGTKTYLLQSPEGQIIETHSISAGLDYPGVGPEHSMLKDIGRAQYMVADDEQALRAFRVLTQREGIIPALESAHAIHGAIELAKTMNKDQDIVVCLSGRGDKDVEQISQLLPGKWAERLDWHVSSEANGSAK